MTIVDLGAALRRFWILAVGVFVAVMLIGVVFALLPAERYRSTVTMLVQPQSEEDLSFAITEAIQFLVPPIIERVGSEEFNAEVRSELPFEDRDVSLQLSAEDEPGTGILFVRAESTEPDVALAAARRARNLLRADPVSSVIEVSVLNPPTEPTSIAASRRAVILVGTAALGLIAAILTAVATHVLRPRSSSAELITERFGLTVLGEIPARRRLPSSVPEVFDGTGPQDVMEAFEKLAVNVDILTAPNSKIAVTSWAQGEGKTVVTAQLAWALASLGHTVTAVDCDLRKPALDQAFDLDADVGVADLTDGATMRMVRQRTPLKSLEVITAGKAGEDRHPAEVIGPAVERILTELGRRTVLIDTPPLFGAETSLITTRVDSVIIVVDARGTQPLELGAALRDLELSNAEVLGAVLNRTRAAPRRRGTYRYYARAQRSSAPG